LQHVRIFRTKALRTFAILNVTYFFHPSRLFIFPEKTKRDRKKISEKSVPPMLRGRRSVRRLCLGITRVPIVAVQSIAMPCGVSVCKCIGVSDVCIGVEKKKRISRSVMSESDDARFRSPLGM